MKRGAYWFKFLTEKEQEEFKENAIDYKGYGWYYYLTNHYRCSSFHEFILRAFVWCDTKQEIDSWNYGYYNFYWCEIANRFKEDEDDGIITEAFIDELNIVE